MKGHARSIVAAAGVIAAAGAALLLLRRPPAFDPAGTSRDLNVILVTLDTTRADTLSCYGGRDVRTPVLDRFAARGARFERCYAQTPLTLPSHVTLMTGTLPLYHGVRDNGSFLVPQKLATMAELFREKGYETGAFLGAWVLDSKWGLNQGFGTYFDDFALSRFAAASFDTVRRPANEVLDAALPWIESRKGKKFFAWIHIYDPHAPYQPPPPYDREYAGRLYFGAIAFVDAQLGRLWRTLEANGLLGRSLVVIAGDHGESLGEHGERTHGFFVYDAAIRVPLIVAAPFPEFRGRIVPGAVGLVDVLPTVAGLAGLRVPAEVQGSSLLPALLGRAAPRPRPVYSETYYPRFHYGWSELRTVLDGRRKIILAPVPELYDLDADPGERTNLAGARPGEAAELRAAAEALIRDSSRGAIDAAAAGVDAETREKLAALGYVGSFADPAGLRGKTLPDPKDRIGVYNDLARAREMEAGGDADGAIRAVGEIVARDPEGTSAAYDILGACYIARNDLVRAGESLRRALDLNPALMNAHYKLGWIAEKQGRPAEAEAEYIRETETTPGHIKAFYNLARVYQTVGELEKARQALAKCLEVDPKFALPYLYAARIDLVRGERYDEAIGLTLKALDLDLDPEGRALGWGLLAELYRRVGDEARSREYAARARAR
ncbi:MAG: sulfatase-like hydrolase/transferase [Acidobacteriota bacterium]